MALASELASRGMRVFIDAKLLDIEATVERATRRFARNRAEFLTVHAVDRKTLDAAVRGRGDSKPQALGVTVLTNLGPATSCSRGPTFRLTSSCCIGPCWHGRLASTASSPQGSRPRRSGTPRAQRFSSSRRASGLRAAQPRDQARVATPCASAIAAGADISWSGGRSPRH